MPNSKSVEHQKHATAPHVIFCCTCALIRVVQEPLRPTSPAVDDALRAAESLLDSIKEGGGLPSMSSSDLGFTDFGYACDENGCVLVVQQDSTNATGGSTALAEKAARIQHAYALGSTAPVGLESCAHAACHIARAAQLNVRVQHDGKTQGHARTESVHAAAAAARRAGSVLAVSRRSTFQHWQCSRHRA
jgi:hypothetical protein